jgi:cobalt/nickel transport system permease protein
MIELFHILFAPVLSKKNFLRRLDARIKVIFCIIILILNLTFPGNLFQLSFLVFYLLFALMGKIKLIYILGRIFIPLLIAIFFMLSGLADLHLALVIMTGVACISLLSFTTSIEEVLLALRKFKIPKTLLEIIFFIYKYISIFFQEAQTIYHAQISRLGYLNFKNSLRSLTILVGMLIVRSFSRAQAIYEAILARGYREELFY